MWTKYLMFCISHLNVYFFISFLPSHFNLKASGSRESTLLVPKRGKPSVNAWLNSCNHDSSEEVFEICHFVDVRVNHFNLLKGIIFFVLSHLFLMATLNSNRKLDHQVILRQRRSLTLKSCYNQSDPFSSGYWKLKTCTCSEWKSGPSFQDLI